MLKEKNKILYLIGVILILMSLTIHIYDEYKNSQIKAIEEEKIEEFFLDEPIEVEENNEEEKKETITETESYSMILEIKDIKLNKGIYDINSKLNNVDKNIEILNNSDLPNQENSIVVLASHSGTSSVAYFSNLTKLELSDKASLFYKGVEYIYELDNIQTVEKTGNVSVGLNQKEKSLILITCKNNSNEQFVYVFYLNEEVNY